MATDGSAFRPDDEDVGAPSCRRLLAIGWEPISMMFVITSEARDLLCFRDDVGSGLQCRVLSPKEPHFSLASVGATADTMITFDAAQTQRSTQEYRQSLRQDRHH